MSSISRLFYNLFALPGCRKMAGKIVIGRTAANVSAAPAATPPRRPGFRRLFNSSTVKRMAARMRPPKRAPAPASTSTSTPTFTSASAPVIDIPEPDINIDDFEKEMARALLEVIAHSEKPAASSRAAGRTPRSSQSGMAVDDIKPVISQDGTLSKQDLRRFMEKLSNGLPPLPNAGKAALRYRSQLVARFRESIPALTKTGGFTPQEMLKFRDVFAAAEGDARSLAARLRRRAPEQALYYQRFASMCRELKRIHLTAAAPFLMNEYVERETANLKKQSPGLATSSGSNIVTSNGAGVSYAPLGSRHFGPSARLGLTGKNTILFDDDRSYNDWDSKEVALQGGLLRGLLRGTARLTGEAGRHYFESATLEKMVALRADRDVNRSFLRSASPHVRAAVFGMQKMVRRIDTGLLNRLYAPESEKPYFLSDEKLVKGANTTRLHVLADQLGTRRAHAVDLGKLVKAAYPSTVERLARYKAPVFREPLAATVPLADPIGRSIAPFVNCSAAVSAGISSGKTLTGYAGPGGELTGSLSANSFAFRVRNQLPAHRLAAPPYHPCMADTLRVQSLLDALADGSPGRMHLYARMRSRITAAKVLAAPRNEEDAAHEAAVYGPPDKIAPQFHGSITGTDAIALQQRLRVIATQCRRLSQQYKRFIKHAEQLIATPDTALFGVDRQRLGELRRDAFDYIWRDIWGHRYPDTNMEARRAALSNPQKFIARSFDAISAALSCAGTHLAIIKRRLDRLSPGDAEARACSLDADKDYADAARLLDSCTPGLKRETIYRYGLLTDTGLSRRHHVVLQATGGGGMRINLGALIPQLEVAIPNPDIRTNSVGGNAAARATQVPGNFDVANKVAQGVVSVSCRYRHADWQLNPNRLGDFLDFNISTQAGDPLTAPLLMEAIRRMLQKVIPIPSHKAPGPKGNVAQLRVHSDRIAPGIRVNAFQASQQASTICS